MTHKLKGNLTKDEKRKPENIGQRHISKIEALYMSIICLTVNCLSAIVLEPGGRPSLGNTVTKSAAFNSLFRRSYNLKIKILATNVIAGLISTVMITLGDKYGIPYLYLPWLVNTIKGMVFYEGPALLNLARVLLPNVTFPAGSFVLTTFLLYVEELCIWSDVLRNFRGCWISYHYRKKYTAARKKDELPIVQKKKLPCRNNEGKDLNVAVEISRDHERSVNLCDKSDSHTSMDSAIKSIKSAIDGKNNFVRNRFLDVTG